MICEYKKRPIKTGIRELIEDIKGGDVFKRERAIEILSGLNDGEVVDATLPLLYEKDAAIRMAALEILKNVGKAKIDAILHLFSEKNEDVRVFACEIVAMIKEERALPYLFSALKKDSENVRCAACSALGEFSGMDVLYALIEALDDTEWVSFSAIQSLGKLKEKKAIPFLFRIMEEKNGLLGMAAFDALLSFKDKEVLRELAYRIKGFEEDKRNDFLKIVAERIDEDSFPVFYELFGDELFLHLREAITTGCKRTKDAISVLKYFKSCDSVELVIQVLKELGPDHEDYESALVVLSELKDVWRKNLKIYLEKGEEDLQHIIRAAIKEGVKIDEDSLIQIFVKSSVELKRLIAEHLERICLDGKNLLSLALKDADGHVRGEAAEMIGRKMFVEMEEEILRLVRNDYPDVRRKALKSLLILNKKRAKTEIERFVKDGGQVEKKIYASLCNMLSADENYPLVKRLINSTDIEERKIAIRVIEQFVNDERYMHLLSETLNSKLVPHEALKVVREKKLTRFKERVVGIFLSEKDLWTKYFALLALASFNDDSLFSVFLEAIEDKNPLIRIAGIKGLLSIRNKKDVELYIARLKLDSDENVRMEAEIAEKQLRE